MASSDMRSNMVPLKENNYATWRVQCRMALIREGLWTIVNKEEEIPEVDEERFRESMEARRKFKTRYDRALTTIVLSVSPQLLYLLGVEPKDPVEAWDTLENQFQKRTWANKLTLKRKLSSMKLKDSQSVSEHIRAMTEIFQELSIIGEPMEEEDRVVQLLTSLPKKFNVLVTALESNPEVPSMEIVTERIMHEDSKLKESESHKDRNQALYAGREGRRESEPYREPPSCYYCKKVGHIQRNCEKLKRKQEAQEKQDSRRNKNKYQSKSHKANFSKSRPQEDESDSSSDSESGFCVIGEHALASVTEEEKKKWLVDSGATKHMGNDKEQFDELTPLE